MQAIQIQSFQPHHDVADGASSHRKTGGCEIVGSALNHLTEPNPNTDFRILAPVIFNFSQSVYIYQHHPSTLFAPKIPAFLILTPVEASLHPSKSAVCSIFAPLV